MGERMKYLRVKAGLTQHEVARKMHVGFATYNRWENYKTFPSAPQLKKLAEIFGCNMDDFYFPDYKAR